VTWEDCLDGAGALDPAAAAHVLRAARTAGSTLDVLLSESAGLSLADAYLVQDEITASRLASAEWRSGSLDRAMWNSEGVRYRSARVEAPMPHATSMANDKNWRINRFWR